NTYLALWSELGIVAGSIPILLVAVGFVAIAIRFRGSRSRLDTAPQAAAIAVTVTCAVHSLAAFSLEVAANTLIFLAILACGLATSWQRIRQGKPGVGSVASPVPRAARPMAGLGSISQKCPLRSTPSGTCMAASSSFSFCNNRSSRTLEG